LTHAQSMESVVPGHLRDHKKPPTQQHCSQRRHKEDWRQPQQPDVTQQVAFSKADDVKCEHEQDEL
jgi:hypothetical protein